MIRCGQPARQVLLVVSWLSLLAVVLTACGAAFDPAEPRSQADLPEITLPYPGFVDLPLSRQELIANSPGSPLAPGTPLAGRLVDSGGGVVRVFSWPLANDSGPAETVEIRLLQSALDLPLTAGSYALRVGFDPADRGRQVARIRVPVSSPALPVFDYTKVWSWIEPLPGYPEKGCRWLDRSLPGTLRVAEIDRPGKVAMSVLIPAKESRRQTFVDSATRPAARIATNCGGAELTVEGEGVHTLELDLVPPAAAPGALLAAVCGVTITPNFYFEPEGQHRRRSVAIFDLAWRFGVPPGEDLPKAR